MLQEQGRLKDRLITRLERIQNPGLAGAKNLLYENDVPLFFQETTGLIPDEFQKEYLSTDAEDILITWCRQGSKTETAAAREAHAAVFRPDSLGLVISATQRQAAILQRRIVRILRALSKHDGRGWRKIKTLEILEDPLNENSRMIRCSVLSLELANGSEIISLPPHPDTIRGYSPNRITIDEAARVPDSTYDAIRPMRAAHRCTLSILSTPKSTFGFFYREVTGDDPVWWRSTMDADQCPRITKEFLDRERTKMSSEAMFQAEYFLKFMPPSGAIFNMELIESMFVPEGSYASWAPSDHELIAKGVNW